MDFENLWTSTHPKNFPENLHWCLFPPPNTPLELSKSPVTFVAGSNCFGHHTRFSLCHLRKKTHRTSLPTTNSWRLICFFSKKNRWYIDIQEMLKPTSEVHGYSHGMSFGGMFKGHRDIRLGVLEDSGMLRDEVILFHCLFTEARDPKKVACSFWRGVVRMAITKDLLRSYFHVPWV